MFVLDFVTAAILAVAFTIAFAALARKRMPERTERMSLSAWIISLVSWTTGILILVLLPVLTRTHWIAFAVAVVVLGTVVALLLSNAKVRRALFREAAPPARDPRPILWYFVFTLLLFFCAISFRFYVVAFT
ncbi:MAG TPA: hypothetical protein VG095_03045 [Chthoniobacterales bacterium]|nr:hypothetical protein [Chthoniobacterales bacterium]